MVQAQTKRIAIHMAATSEQYTTLGHRMSLTFSSTSCRFELSRFELGSAECSVMVLEPQPGSVSDEPVELAFLDGENSLNARASALNMRSPTWSSATG